MDDDSKRKRLAEIRNRYSGMGADELGRLDLYQVDAFTDKPFSGNPAAVCLLQEKLEDRCLQLIAAEMNLSETAFVQIGAGDASAKTRFNLRWFTPLLEVPLCGHATLATAEVLFDEMGLQTEEIVFETLSGELIARRDPAGIVLDFPLDEPEAVSEPTELMAAMGLRRCSGVILGKKTRKLVFVLDNLEDIRNLRPDFAQMKKASLPYEIKGVGVTAAYDGGNSDFVSRYFNPWAGVEEDPVTGSVHTLLAAYWAEQLGRRELRAYQASARGGDILLRVREDNRVEIIGKATIVLRGQLSF